MIRHSVVYSIFMTLCLMVTKPTTQWLTLERRLFLLLFVSQGQRQNTGFYFTCNIVRSMFWTLCFMITKLSKAVGTREWINYCVIATLLYFAPGGHLCFSNISCFISDDWVNQQSSFVHNEAYVEIWFV